MIRIAIVDDHAIVRAGLSALISCESDMELVGEASDGRAALSLVSDAKPDIIIIDLSMPEMDGVEAIRRIHAAVPDTRIIVLSMHGSADYVRPAVRAGADGYLVKGPALDDLVRAIRAVHAGEGFFDPAIRDLVDDVLRGGARDERQELELLTPREKEVLTMVAMGHTNKTIAEKFGLSPKTVDAHRTNLMRKLQIHDAQGLTRLAMRKGLLG